MNPEFEKMGLMNEPESGTPGGVSPEWLETLGGYGYPGYTPSVHEQIDKSIGESDRKILTMLNPGASMLMSLLKKYNDSKLQEEAYARDYSGQTMEQIPFSPMQGVGPQTFEDSPSFGLDYQTDYSGEKIPREQFFKDIALRDAQARREPEEKESILQGMINKLMGK